MSYKTNRNITMIDDLPFLDELENTRSNGLSMIPSDNMPTVQKFIRNNNYNPPFESGMSNQQPPRPQQQPPPPPPQQETDMFDMIDDPRMYMSQNHHQQQLQQQLQHQPPPPQYQPHQFFNHELSCINVADHTTNCIVCSKLYQNNTTGYIIVIILLAIISILLLKRVLNV